MYFPYWHNDNHNVVFGDRALNSLQQDYWNLDELIPSDLVSKQRYQGDKFDNINDAASWFQSAMLKEFFAYLKPFCVDLSETHENNYYMEREWRKLGMNVSIKAHSSSVQSLE